MLCLEIHGRCLMPMPPSGSTSTSGCLFSVRILRKGFRITGGDSWSATGSTDGTLVRATVNRLADRLWLTDEERRARSSDGQSPRS